MPLRAGSPNYSHRQKAQAAAMVGLTDKSLTADARCLIVQTKPWLNCGLVAARQDSRHKIRLNADSGEGKYGLFSASSNRGD
jgi:hypothetical protein